RNRRPVLPSFDGRRHALGGLGSYRRTRWRAAGELSDQVTQSGEPRGHRPCLLARHHARGGPSLSLDSSALSRLPLGILDETEISGVKLSRLVELGAQPLEVLLRLPERPPRVRAIEAHMRLLELGERF